MSGIRSTPDPFAFIQARLSSSRLNQKVLMSIDEDSNESIIAHLFSRLSKVFPANRIFFLIPNEEKLLADFLSEKEIPFLQGSLENVRDRFIQAAKTVNAKDIFRFTADNPFVDLTSIELMKEALFHLPTRFYNLSMNSLPLGMGCECFSFESLSYQNLEWNEERHQEHVSLHIKENLEVNKIYRLVPPHLSLHQQEISNEIRVTVDEILDLQFIRSLWKHFKNTHPFFGATEVLQFHKDHPEITRVNRNVQQIQFHLPKAKPNQKRIHISYGDPLTYGTGHFERCKSLSIELQMKGYLIFCNSLEESEFDAYIYDARECDIPKKPALAIDHLGKLDADVEKVFFLPHPELREMPNDTISFYTSPLLYTFQSMKEQNNHILVYAGSLAQDQSLLLDKFVIERVLPLSKEAAIIRIGGAQPKASEILYYPRIEKSVFYEYLNSASLFITYYGIGMLESLFLKKRTLLYGIGPVHDRLGIFFSKQYAVPYLGNVEHLNFERQMLNERNPNIKIEITAQEKIIRWLAGL
ncbi:hypothetical protein LPTSP4_26980 [Leptospira ryugenii]|uniref:Cytidylyltransferase n=1 Tax=Leptospira ryugenii TaxID=1917863 RepID=A0A2P2E2X2_9LEPT|nr:spore coat biosynthesis protein F [Leptospira ryugenii]GBF51166.1 hypothetical protein LPTSP4_26980 [Leptospira ryugenii]